MTTEDVMACVAMGFILGLFAFAIVMVRIRTWPFRLQSTGDGKRGGEARHDAEPSIQPTLFSVRKAFHAYWALAHIYDLVWLLIILGMLVYGAVMAPRLRIIVSVAAVTVLACWWCWRMIARLTVGGRSRGKPDAGRSSNGEHAT